MLCEVVDEIKDVTENEGDLIEGQSTATPEKGRVWRWRNQSAGSRKNTEGPVLRATVKPVKRFIPELNSTVPPSSGTQNQSTTTTKQVSSTTVDDISTIEVKAKRQPTSLPPQTTFNKKKRVREQWSIEDKAHFFEAVSVHGKDFEAIQKAIAQKHKKRGDESVVKTKDQVRHLYYRTWTTISKLLDHEISSNTFTKGTQELLAVINYGELQKKLGGCILKKKGIIKLNELITFGSTSVRVKGKTYRIKTPSCKALKRIHDREDAAKRSNEIETRRIKLPLRVNLEMHPLSMCAWNHVHLLAHNPRIRFNVPLDCQLSYLLIYLHRKWKSLSSKMFIIAQDAPLDPLTNLSTSTLPDDFSYSLEIHIPPEATIKSKFQVHEIVTTKTHCIVSYVTPKTGKLSGLKKKKKHFEDVDSSDNHPTITNELCNSSEDESAFVDLYSSDIDEQPCNGVFASNDLVKNSNDSECEDLDKAPGSNLDQVTQPDSTDDNDKVIDSFFQETEISAERLDDRASGDNLDSGESLSSDKYLSDVNLPIKDPEQTSQAESAKSDNTAEKDSDPKTNEEIQCMKSPDEAVSSSMTDCYVPLQSTTLDEIEGSIADQPTIAVNIPEQATDMLDNLEGKVESDFAIRNDETDSPSKSSPVSFSIPSFWNEKNVGDTTLAEIFLMLGKPNTFKLCYQWKKKDDDMAVAKDYVGTNQKLPSNLTALIQCATLMLSKVNNASTDNAKNNKESNKNPDGKSDSVGVSVGVQCDISKKNELPKSASSSINVPPKKSGGKGVKKVSTATSTSTTESGDTFAVPNVPNQKKRNQRRIASNSAASNSENGQVCLVDIAFRKQMDALYRRIDLFRTHNRNRSVRKPYIVQRTMMPNAKSVRKMMTLSIDSLGANRVGFLPLANQVLDNNGEPQLEAVGATIPSVSNSTSSSSDLTSTTWNSNNSALNTVSTSSGVLAQAAEEAGLIDIDNAVRLNSTNHCDKLQVEAAPISETLDLAVRDNNQIPTSISPDGIEKVLQAENCSTPADNYQPSMIKNDVSLPIRPLSPNVDSISDIFNFSHTSNDFLVISSHDKVAEGRETPSLSMPVLDLPITPQKVQSPVHPWSINCNSRDGLSGFATLDTPQRILPSDSEDSIDGALFNASKRPRFSTDSSNSYNDAETELQMECLMSENSVDFMTKFQDLIHTPGTNENSIAETSQLRVDDKKESSTPD